MPGDPRLPKDTDRFFIDNTFFRGGWAGRLGPYAIAVYNAIALHVDSETQEAWPSHATIAKLTGMSARQVIREVERLESYNIVSVRSRLEERKPAVITLLDKATWKPIEEDEHMTESHMTDSLVTGSHMTYDSESDEHMTGSHTNKTHKTNNNNSSSPHKNEKKPSAKQAENRAMFGALLKVCKVDLNLITDKARGQFNQIIKIMRDNGSCSEDILKFETWWYENDWRGKRSPPQVPTLQNIRDEWGKFTATDNHKPRISLK